MLGFGCVVAAMQSVVLSGAQSLQQKILGLAQEFSDCMPPPL